MTTPPHRPLLMVGPYPPIIGGTAAMLNRLVPALEGTGVSCRVLNTMVGDRQGGTWERLRRMLFFVGLAWRVLRSPERIVHCHAVNFANLVGHGFVLGACRLGGKRSVITLHAGDLMAKLDHGSSRRLGALVLRLASVVTTVTPELADRASELGITHARFIANDLRYVPHGGDGTDLPPEVDRFIADHSPVVTLVGAMSPTYGVDILLRATSILKRKLPEIGALAIAFKSSDTAYDREIAATIEELNLTDSVLLPGSFPNVAEALRRSNVFVRPTLTDGDSIAVREALTLDLPVVASDVGFRPEGVIRFPVGNHHLMATAIEEALKGPRRGATISEATEKETVASFIEAYRLAARDEAPGQA